MIDGTAPSPTLLYSSGTLHACFGHTVGRLRKILFVPDAQHTVHHQGKTLAVFLPAALPGDARVIESGGAPIILSVPHPTDSVLVQTLTEAAMSQSGVDIEVDFSDPHNPSLSAVTIPAVSNRK